MGDISGIVMSIDLLSVKLQTFDNRFVRIPNESIIKTKCDQYFPLSHPQARY